MPSGEVPCTTTSIAAASCSAFSTAVPPQQQSQVCLTVSQTFGNSRCASGHCWWCGWVSARGSAEGGTDGSARIGSAILYSRACRNSVEPIKPMGHCSIANGSAATAWPGLARTHAHDPTSTQAQAHTQDKGAGLSASGGSARAHTPRREKQFGLPGGHECDAALAPNQSAGVVDELDEPLPRLPRDACSTPSRPTKGSPRQWPVAAQ